MDNREVINIIRIISYHLHLETAQNEKNRKYLKIAVNSRSGKQIKCNLPDLSKLITYFNLF